MYAKDRDGIVRTPLCDDEGSIIVKGTLADAAIEGRLFSIANQAAVNTTAALNTTWTGLGVGNPATSGKNYVFHEFAWTIEDNDDDSGAIGLMIATVGDMAQALTPRCARYGYKTTVALVDDAATPGTPILVRVCGSWYQGANTVTNAVGPQTYNINGSIIIPPGYALLSYTGVASTGKLIFHFLWEEVEV
jgi:hypothetical protein